MSWRIGHWRSDAISIKCRIPENPFRLAPAFKLNSFMSNLGHMLQSKEKFVATQEVDRFNRVSKDDPTLVEDKLSFANLCTGSSH